MRQSRQITYLYDAAGKRVRKDVYDYTGGSFVLDKRTSYVRNAQGQVMAMYTKDYSATDTATCQSEVPLYGMERLGMALPQRPYYDSLPDTVNIYTRLLDEKVYELNDHLGNVRATVGDIKVASGANYIADLKGYNNYFPFGSRQPGRFYESGDIYRYGFNGKEMDNELKGGGNSYDFGYRMHDPRLGRFLSIDPLAASFPWYSPYLYAGNTPISAIDAEGLYLVPISSEHFTKSENGTVLVNYEKIEAEHARLNPIVPYVPHTSDIVQALKNYKKYGRGPTSRYEAAESKRVYHSHLMWAYKFALGHLKRKHPSSLDANREELEKRIEYHRLAAHNWGKLAGWEHAPILAAEAREAAFNKFVEQNEITAGDYINTTLDGLTVVASSVALASGVGSVLGYAGLSVSIDNLQANIQMIWDKANYEYDPEGIYTLGGTISNELTGDAVYYQYTGILLSGGTAVKGGIKFYKGGKEINADAVSALFDGVNSLNATVQTFQKQNGN